MRVAAPVLVAILGAALASAAGADSARDFEDGKALGQSKTGPQVEEIKSGRTASEVPNYTDNPPERSYYRTRDLQTPLSQQQADCAARPSDPTCAGISQGIQSRPPSNVTRADPAFAGEDAQMNPSLILGDIATTYSACSVGSPTLVSPAQFRRETCDSRTEAWTTTQCDKQLSVVPHTRTSCEQGSWVATGQTLLGNLGQVDASALCDLAPPDGMTTFRIGALGSQRKAEPVTADARLSMAASLPALGQDPPKVASLRIAADHMGSTTDVDVFAYGPGCIGDDCALSFYYFAGGTKCTFEGGDGGIVCEPVAPGFLEAKYACPLQQLAGNELYFVTCVQDGEGQTCAEERGDRHQCWAKSRTRGALLAHPLANSEVGYWSRQGPSTPTQQAIVVPSTPPGQPMTSLSLAFSRPRVLATANESWNNACAAFEGITPMLPADGVAGPGGPSLPAPMPTGQQQCVRTASMCLDGPSTRLIDGEEVTRQCWHWQNTFACTALSAGSTCTDPRFAGCSQAGEYTCEEQDGQGHCLKAEAQYDCKIADAVYSQALNCGDQNYCAGGSCYDTTYAPNENFAFAVAHMEAREEAGQQFDAANLQIFKGSPGHCDKDTWGLRDCCDANGDFIQCEADERETVRQREEGQCHYIGNFCSERDWLGGCLCRTYSYCCFPSMLARIVQEQGRPQLQRDWGSSREPSCEGFTVEEFQNLDWSRIDLSEFYASITPAPIDNGGNAGRAGEAQDNCYYGGGRCGP
ncbi:conjugal transfer protein TraN [Ideonella sp. YS5]|uniref:conjugal transfer protein TraN n=1 Tax=Ideonella sp. YS5 TaxID=3453714 RepID=UPI003EEED416